MNNRFSYNMRQNRPPGFHQRPQFNYNQQQQLNPRAPQFYPHSTSMPIQPQQTSPGFNNMDVWNPSLPGFHHQTTNIVTPSNLHHSQNWNPNNFNQPPPQMMSDPNQKESGNFKHQQELNTIQSFPPPPPQQQQMPQFHAQNTLQARASFFPPPRFTPPFLSDNIPRQHLPPSKYISVQ